MLLFVNQTILNDLGRIHIDHRLTPLFAAPIRVAPDHSVLHGILYGFDGDLLVGSQVKNLAIPVATFDPTAILQVPRRNLVNPAITRAARHNMLGPYENNDEGTKHGVTCHICWLPPKCAVMALHLRSTSPMSFFTTVPLLRPWSTTRQES